MVMANAGSSSRNEDGCSSQPQQSELPVYLQPKPAVLKPERSRQVDHDRLRAILERKSISDFEDLASDSNKVGVDFSSLKGILGRSAVPSLEVNRAMGTVDLAGFRADMLVFRKKRSLRSLLTRFTDVSKCFLDEIAGLGGTQVGESVTRLVKSMVCKSSLHLEQVNGALKAMQSGKVNIVAAGGEQGDRDGVEALANQEKRRLEAAKLSLEADKVRLETDKVRLEADKVRLEGDKRRLQAEVEAANTAAATYLRRIEDEASCLICMTNPRNVVLLPCFHGHYCNECIERHRKTNKYCPSCRAVIKGRCTSAQAQPCPEAEMRKQSAAAFDDLRAQSAVFKPGARSRDRRLTLLRIGQLAKLTEKLDQVTEASKALVDEIAGLEGLPGQIEIAELTVVRNKFRKTQSHFEEASKEFEKLQSRKLVTLEAETWRLRKAAAEDRSKLEAERALANEDKNKLEAEKRVLQAEVQVAEHSRQMLENESSCQICMDSAKNVVLLPCFHAQFCSQCIDTHRKTNTTCPTCRSVIQGTMPCIA